MSAEIEISDLELIKSLSFVIDIQPVRRSDPMSIKTDISESWTAGEYSYVRPTTLLDYGRSFDQNEQIEAIWAHEQGYHGEGVLICFLDTLI